VLPIGALRDHLSCGSVSQVVAAITISERLNTLRGVADLAG
jgi:hypothetical protein